MTSTPDPIVPVAAQPRRARPVPVAELPERIAHHRGLADAFQSIGMRSEAGAQRRLVIELVDALVAARAESTVEPKVSEIRAEACDTCHAAPGEPCCHTIDRLPVLGHHPARVRSAVETLTVDDTLVAQYTAAIEQAQARA